MESGIVNAVGAWFYAINTQRYLYLMRNDSRHQGTWGLPGGRIEAGETLLQALQRECKEELGSMPDYMRLLPLEKFTNSSSNFVYHTFFCSVATEFTPTLNDEHLGYAWVDRTIVPKPLHQGLWSTINFHAVQSKITSIEQALQ